MASLRGTTINSRADSLASTVRRPQSPDGSNPRSPPRTAPPLPTPRAFLSPKKPPAAIRLERREKDRTTNSHRHSREVTQFPAESGPSRMTYSSSEFGMSPEPVPLSIDATLSRAPNEDRFRHSNDHYNEPNPRRSITDNSTPPQTPRGGLSSDHLMINGRSIEKPNSQPPQVSLKRRSRPPRRVRNWKKLNNPQTTFICGGRLMTGGDSPLSVILSVLVIFSLTGVWLATTGSWLWVDGQKYGLPKGAGIAIVVIFALVRPKSYIADAP